MLKIVIWCCAVAGFIPLTYLLLIGATMLSHAKAVEKQVRNVVSPGIPGIIDIHIHDSYVAVGSLQMTWYPRAWALFVVGAGLMLTFCGLIFLLHVPSQ
jgi:hypothetical protein